MAGERRKTVAAKDERPPAPKATDSRDGLSVAELAQGILSKEIRPRAVDVRRLAEAVVAAGSGKPKKASKKADSGKKKNKSKKKLAKIPGQSKN